MAIVIAKSREVEAGPDAVWEALVDWGRETKYWNNVKNVRILKNDGRTIEREATVGPRGFAQKTKQTLVLDPKKSLSLAFAGDSVSGERTVLLVPLGQNRTRVQVAWSFQLDGVPEFVQGIVRGQIARVTEDALDKIAKAAERGT